MSLGNLTRDLISIDSVTGNEDAILEYIDDYLKKSGYIKKITLHEGGLVAGDHDGSAVVALVGHVDTVPISNNQVSLDESNAIYGRGAVDMKSGIAVMIECLINFQEKNIVGVFYKGEEGLKEHNGLETLFPVLNENFDISFGIIFEPTNNEVQLGCQGVVNAALRIIGEEAHSARPWLGDNAIYKSIPVLEKLNELAPEPVLVDELEYKEVINATTISGGNAKNVIPGEVLFNINYRFSPDKTNDDAVESLNKFFSPFGELTITDVAESAYPHKNDDNIQKFIDFTSTNVEPKQAWTDVARFTSEGIPAINFGPGDPELAHKANENVPLTDIEDCYELIKKYLQKGVE